jgi:hypothetical protein
MTVGPIGFIRLHQGPEENHTRPVARRGRADAGLRTSHERCFLPDTAVARPVAVLLRLGKTPSGKTIS